MAKKDLGTCVIMSKDDLKNLHANLDNYNKIEEYFNTDWKKGFSYKRINSKLREDVEKKAREKSADLAIIFNQADIYGFFPQRMYSFWLYKINS